MNNNNNNINNNSNIPPVVPNNSDTSAQIPTKRGQLEGREINMLGRMPSHDGKTKEVGAIIQVYPNMEINKVKEAIKDNLNIDYPTDKMVILFAGKKVEKFDEGIISAGTQNNMYFIFTDKTIVPTTRPLQKDENENDQNNNPGCIVM